MSETTEITKYEMDQQLEIPKSYGANMSPELASRVSSLISSIDVHDRSKTQALGIEEQASIGSFYDQILNGVGTKEVGEAGDILVSVMGQINGFNAECSKPSTGLFGFLRKQKDKISAMQTRYRSLSDNMERTVSTLRKKQADLQGVSHNFDAMYERNMNLIGYLTMLVYAGEQALEAERAKAVQIQAEAEASGDLVEIQRAADFNGDLDRFEKRLYDLKLSRTVAIQQGPQIRNIQKSADEIADSINTTIVTAIPLWKGQMAMALGMRAVEDGIKARNSVLDATNAMILANAKANHAMTVEAAKASERGVVDIDTIQKVNEELISAFTESSDIIRSAKLDRANGAKQLRESEESLRKAIEEYARVM